MSMDIYSVSGTKVMFLDKNGSDYDRVEAEKVLKVGQIYTIVDIQVSSWISHVKLEEVSGRFNSVMFDNIRLE